MAKHLGLQYVYQEMAAVATPSANRQLTGLAELDEVLRSDLEQALISLDTRRIEIVIREIDQQIPELAAILIQYTENYNYQPLLDALAANAKRRE